MSESVTMPALGESVTEGTVTRWLKSVGERVEVDEPLLEVSTDKVDTEIPSPIAGVVEQILVPEDETVDVGTALATIGSGASAPAPAQTAQTPAPAEPAAPPVEAPPAPPAQAAPVPAPAPATPPAPSAGGQMVTMPALGESVTEGTVTRWLKAPGDQVAVDEPLLEVSTDKVDTEVPSPVAGTVGQLLVAEDETVDVGTPLVEIGSGAAPAPAAPPTPAAAVPMPPAPAPVPQPAAPPAPPLAAPVAQPQAQAPAPLAQPQASAPAPAAAPSEPAPTTPRIDAPAVQPAASGHYVTPLVRKLAADKGVDLSTLTGTGVGGRIRKEDVLDAAKAAEQAAAAAVPPAPQSTPAPAKRPAEVSPLRGTTEKMTRLRKLVAARMVEALQTTAQLTTVVEVDVTRIARLRARAKDDFARREGAKLTFLPFFAQAAVEALKAHPKVNASIDGDQIVYHGQENLGIAVDTERGLVVPVIHDAGDLNLAGLARKISDLAARTRANKVSPDELAGGTFTITNTGSGGALIDTPIVPQPQAAILGTGTIVKRPAVVRDADGNETIGIRSMVYLCLSYDHRLIDGADAARYLMEVKNRLEEGAFESDLGL